MTGPPTTRVHREARRRERKPNLVIQERDLGMLRAIFENRLLTRDLLLGLFPSNPARTPTKAIEAARQKRLEANPSLASKPQPGTNLDRRLYGLFEAGLLDRYRAGPGGQFAYAITWKGIELLQAEDSSFPLRPASDTRDRERQRRSWAETTRSGAPGFIDHTLAVARFRVSLIQGVREAPGVVLERFEREHPGLAAVWRVRPHTLHPLCRASHKRLDEIALYPDAFFLLRDGDDRTLPCFLEIDRGGAQLNRLRERFLHYERMYSDRVHRARFGIDTFRVLTVAPRPGRASNLLGLLVGDDLLVDHRHRSLFLFTAEEAYFNDPTNVCAAIWRGADQPDERRGIVGSPIPRRPENST